MNYSLKETNAMIAIEIARLMELSLESCSTREIDKKGDYVCNIAFKLSPLLKKPPQEIAELICNGLKECRTFSWHWDKAEAKNGFINLYISKEILIANLANIKDETRPCKD